MARHETTHDAGIEIAGRPIGDRLAELDGVYVRIVPGTGIPVAVRPHFAADHQFSEHDLRVLNWAFRDRGELAVKTALASDEYKNYSDADRQSVATAMLNGGAMVNGATVKPYSFPADFGQEMSLLEEAIDRVRWDSLVASGKTAGNYAEHSGVAEQKGRAGARAKIREAFDRVCDMIPGGRTYGELVLAKAAEVLAARYPVKTRTPASSKANNSDEI